MQIFGNSSGLPGLLRYLRFQLPGVSHEHGIYDSAVYQSVSETGREGNRGERRDVSPRFLLII